MAKSSGIVSVSIGRKGGSGSDRNAGAAAETILNQSRSAHSKISGRDSARERVCYEKRGDSTEEKSSLGHLPQQCDS